MEVDEDILLLDSNDDALGMSVSRGSSLLASTADNTRQSCGQEDIDRKEPRTRGFRRNETNEEDSSSDRQSVITVIDLGNDSSFQDDGSRNFGDETLERFSRGMRFQAEEIELSSDEENEEEDEIQVLTVRPKSKSQLLSPLNGTHDSTTLEVVDERTMFSEKQNLNLKVRDGYVKEYIESEGLGFVFSLSCGLALFHLNHVWIDGRRCPRFTSLPPGTEIKFLVYTFEGDEFTDVSQEGVFRQAAVVWTGERPQHILKLIKTERYDTELKTFRNTFLDYFASDIFMDVSLVRIRGRVKGYLTAEMGFIEVTEGNAKRDLIIFHLDNVYLFREKLELGENKLFEMIPVGLNVCVDARRLSRPFRGVDFQACAVFAGNWPRVPHPVIFPGGPGSEAPCYGEECDGTFYYVSLDLPVQLDRLFKQFQNEVSTRGTRLIETNVAIDCAEDYHEWRATHAPPHISNRRQSRGRKKTLFHTFKRTIAELEDSKEKNDMDATTSSKVIKLEDTNGVDVKTEPIVKKEEPL